jgi:serpin (serine protease inhibitor)
MSLTFIMRISMIVDRPFFFVICDNYTNTILFMGSVEEPDSYKTEPAGKWMAAAECGGTIPRLKSLVDTATFSLKLTNATPSASTSATAFTKMRQGSPEAINLPNRDHVERAPARRSSADSAPGANPWLLTRDRCTRRRACQQRSAQRPARARFSCGSRLA